MIWGGELVKNCVTSFIDDPLVKIDFDLDCLFKGYFELSVPILVINLKQYFSKWKF
jgi:hypothetical protein